VLYFNKEVITMCQYASFFHNPVTKEVKVKVLDSHGETEKALKLDPKIWREGHYLPGGEIELRLTDDDRVNKDEYMTAFKNRFPTLRSFMLWANQFDVTVGSLNLGGLTSAKDLVLPKDFNGSLYLNGLTTEERQKVRNRYLNVRIY
jgi:hypothetical protein